MFLLYADASGTADPSDSSTRHYVLLGLAVHEGTWFALNKRLNGLKSSYCQSGDEFELHAAEFACTIKEQDEIAGFASMQLVDICAYAVRRYLDKNALVGSYEAMRRRTFSAFSAASTATIWGNFMACVTTYRRVVAAV